MTEWKVYCSRQLQAIFINTEQWCAHPSLQLLPLPTPHPSEEREKKPIIWMIVVLFIVSVLLNDTVLFCSMFACSEERCIIHHCPGHCLTRLHYTAPLFCSLCQSYWRTHCIVVLFSGSVLYTAVSLLDIFFQCCWRTHCISFCLLFQCYWRTFCIVVLFIVWMLYAVPLFCSLFQYCWRTLYHWPVHCFSAVGEHCTIGLFIVSVLLENTVPLSVHCFSATGEHCITVCSLFQCYWRTLCHWPVHCFSALHCSMYHCPVHCFSAVEGHTLLSFC